MHIKDIPEVFASLPADDTFFAKEPWTPDAEVRVVSQEANDEKEQLKRLGFKYFLEVFVVTEVLEGTDDVLSPEQKVSLVIYYATFDAYPDWFKWPP